MYSTAYPEHTHGSNSFRLTSNVFCQRSNNDPIHILLMFALWHCKKCVILLNTHTCTYNQIQHQALGCLYCCNSTAIRISGFSYLDGIYLNQHYHINVMHVDLKRTGCVEDSSTTLPCVASNRQRYQGRFWRLHLT